MNENWRIVLDTLYQIESESFASAEFDCWTTVAQIADRLPSEQDDAWVAKQLQELWIGRKVMQLPSESAVEYTLHDIVLSAADAHSDSERRIPVEDDDCRGNIDSRFEQVALYDDFSMVKYRSRVAEIARLLSSNYQRFNMSPATGLLRYVRREQERPKYESSIEQLIEELCSSVDQGTIPTFGYFGTEEKFSIDPRVHASNLSTAIRAVLESLSELFKEGGREGNLAEFQVKSIIASLCGLYCPEYRSSHDAHVVTAGVGSGKSFSFQIGAIIHVAYKSLLGERHLQVLLLYPRVVLAANQFQDLFELFDRIKGKIGVPLAKPFLDAGGNLRHVMGVEGQAKGGLMTAIRLAYQGVGDQQFQMAISNLDTLTNRIAHPESCQGLSKDLDLIVVDEAHLLSGLYGGHAKMFLRRLELQQKLWRLRDKFPQVPIGDLLHRLDEVEAPYFIGASATMAEPRRHFGTLISRPENRILWMEIANEEKEPSGWVHHMFLRQRPEVSSTTAVTNATSCLIHNRRDGLHREYYQMTRVEGESGEAISLSDLPNPIQSPNGPIKPRDTNKIHKSVGFCDSLDGVGLWEQLIADNEGTLLDDMGQSPNPSMGDLPYFVRFQEPLWRVAHHASFSSDANLWIHTVAKEYGDLCRKCKQGVRCSSNRIPSNITAAQERHISALWNVDTDNNDDYKKSYLGKLKVDKERRTEFLPILEAAQSDTLENLDGCPFYQTSLCWWWSMDHIGNNHPRPASHTDPVAGFKQPHGGQQTRYHPANAIRVRAFTSKHQFDVFESSSINDLFRSHAAKHSRNKSPGIFHNRFPASGYSEDNCDNCALVIGSPRLEVGIDLARASDGITFRAMRDPASLQQKVGRVGREPLSDSLMVHIVTENARDHFYFRNPEIALSPDFLQPIPLHENNRIIARNHYFMAIVDFISLLGTGPSDHRIASDGHRVALINDHLYEHPFRGQWADKVRAVSEFFKIEQNRQNLTRYLGELGAQSEEVFHPNAPILGPKDAPTSKELGAADVFLHEFGENLLLTKIETFSGESTTLAEACSYRVAPDSFDDSQLPRHSAFHSWMNESQDEVALKRSYLWDILTIPLFSRGMPSHNLPSNQPYLWTRNLFEPVGNKYVGIQEKHATWTAEIGSEPLSLALSLLAPGSFTYRYTEARKVPVSEFGGLGTATQGANVERVRLDIHNSEFFEPSSGPALKKEDLPEVFRWTGHEVHVHTPRLVTIASARNKPLVTLGGLIVDGDERASQPGQRTPELPVPPRCYALKWFRVLSGEPDEIPCRFFQKFRGPGGALLDRLPRPQMLGLFEDITYDSRMQVTEFVWGLDRQFMSREVPGGRLVYWQEDPPKPTALGQDYQAPGIRFDVNLSDNSPIGKTLQRVWDHPHSGVGQSTLLQLLTHFLSRHAGWRDPDAPPNRPAERPSIFVVRNLRSLLLFHLLDRWHPDADSESRPDEPFWLSFELVKGLFKQGHPMYLDETRFNDLCRRLANLQNPSVPDGRANTLRETWSNYQEACRQVNRLDESFRNDFLKELFLNTLGISLHTAGLRLTGAESSNLGYFYRRENEKGAVFLFDTDAYGNGTVDVIRRNFHVSCAERILTTRLRALGASTDALPTLDFAHVLEEEFQECSSSHAAQLAFYELSADEPHLKSLDPARISEGQIAGPLYKFIREHLGQDSFDCLPVFQACPEFLAAIGKYPVYVTSKEWSLPSQDYPSFQALESAFGCCIHGCVECVLAPETNIHGVLTSRDTVNKLLLDTVYRECIVKQDYEFAMNTYPADGPARTTSWRELAKIVSSAIGKDVSSDEYIVELESPEGATRVRVRFQFAAGVWSLVFRTNWETVGAPVPKLRPRMDY